MYLNRIKILLFFILISSSTTFAQNYNRGNRQQRGRDYSIVPRSNTTPSTKDNEKEFKEKLDRHIQNFINKLDVDEFQKHIIRQKLDSYFVEKMSLLKSGIENREDLEERINYLNNTHFNDLKEMTSVHIQDSIQKFIKIREIEPSNKKKKKRKRKKDN